jgi:CubicO group peptidase (beta-lactamase class C family)
MIDKPFAFAAWYEYPDAVRPRSLDSRHLENTMRTRIWIAVVSVMLLAVTPAWTEEPRSTKAALANYFPPPESKGGWRTLLPETGEPNAEQKAAIAKMAGVDWDKLKLAWEHNAAIEGSSGLLVIRHGHIVGEWYKNGGRDKTFNIYSSSKAYTSLAFGLLLAEHEGGKLSQGKRLTLDTKVCNADWLPESLPLPDPRKADITVRHLLNMASGIGGDNVPANKEPFEIALGHTEKSPFKMLKADPGKKFIYSNAGVAHLVLIFQHAAGEDEFPYLKKRIFDPAGMENLKWTQMGGKDGKIGPFSQGYSGMLTTPREHARFCYLALHKGDWSGKQLVPASHYDFAWKSTKTNPTYGGQWWVFPRHKDGPRDLVQTAGAFNNDGYVVPSLDLVFVRLGDGKKFPRNWASDLVQKVVAAVNK